tara:strand:+ start:71 stop:2533 length:2463 start_codon:yes stop_codon:yes gene_type:complete
MKLSEIRERFIKFFEDRDHKFYESAPLVPKDKSVLFTIAGMVPFKQFFLGYDKAPSSRATSPQRCIRTSDIDVIGSTARHLTSFEMLGNFSFGDYFKEEAIKMGWELITKELGIDRNRLIVTVYKDDIDAFRIWEKIIPASQIVKLDKDNNFWEMGETGPCGPSSEIYYAFDGINDFDPDDERFIEIYNMVFMEFNKDGGSISHLPNKNIDTGMGLERVAMVMQRAETVFDIDVMIPLKSSLRSMTDVINDKAEKIILDHIRAACFLVYDGVRPSNEKQGYVLRRLIRRAAKFGYEMGLSNFLYKLVKDVAESYPFIKEKINSIERVIRKEEEKFDEVLSRGLDFAKNYIEATDEETLDSDFVFKLYDTYGFPIELTKDLALKYGKKVDEDAYNRRFKEHQELSRKNKSFTKDRISEQELKGIPSTIFTGYHNLEDKGNLIKVREIDDRYEMIFDKSCFYAESGGQVADRGTVSSNSFKGKVVDVQKCNDVFIHYVEGVEGEPEKGVYDLKIDEQFRSKVKANHTATHLLHSAVKNVLGSEVGQAGSLVTDEKLRLDLNIDRAISNRELEEIEVLVNREILKNSEITTTSKNIEDAKKEGAIAYFEDRYGDVVRVVTIPNFSKELCGGTHASHTGEIGLFKIVYEKSISSGIRRIEAITGLSAYEYLKNRELELKSVASKLNSQEKDILSKIDNMIEKQIELKNKLSLLENKVLYKAIESSFVNPEVIDGVKVVEVELEPNLISRLAKIKDRSNYLIFAFSIQGDLVLITDRDFNLGAILKKVLVKMGKKGGGRPDFARTKLEHNEIKEVIDSVKENIFG